MRINDEACEKVMKSEIYCGKVRKGKEKWRKSEKEDQQ